MIKYRFKTEKEFIEQYGKNWRTAVTCGWSTDMDKMLGKPMKQLDDFDNKELVYINNWFISRDMITNYKQTVELTFKDRKVTATYGGYYATAQCNKEDEYNENFGVAIALSRLARKLGEYSTEKIIKIQEKHNILEEI